MRFVIVRSSSSGNCTIIKSKGTIVLLDFGVAKRNVEESLASLGTSLKCVDGLLLTHGHTDHIKNANIINKEKVYGNKITLEKVFEDFEEKNIVKDYQNFKINNLLITPFPLSHDFPCTGYLIDDGAEKLALVTDTGYVPDKDLKLITNCDYYLFEADYDPKLLYNCQRPEETIKRISSDYGHLSNEDCGYNLSMVVGDKTKEIYLYHLSSDNNSEDLALSTVKKVFKAQHVFLDNIKLCCTKKEESVTGGIFDEEKIFM